MYSLILLALTSFVLALVLTPLWRNLFRHLGWQDEPDHTRKLHREPIPHAGGVPILLACAGAYVVLFLSPLHGGVIAAQGLPLVWKILPALGVVFLTGLWDDLLGLRPWQKLVLEVAAAGWVWWMGVRVMGVGGVHVAEWWSLPLTLAWFIGCTNAFNLIDGVDGLAAGVGLFATTATLVAALLQNNFPLQAAVVPLAGALLGFLRYNFNPASIFLGDCGSLSLGFLLGCYGVIWSQKSATLLGMTAPLIVLAIPLLDVCLSIARRFLRGQPIFKGDRGHIHHQLLARGLTPRRVALLLYGVCGLFAALSLLVSVDQHRYAGAIVVLFCGATWLGVNLLGYVEFNVAKRMFLGGSFQQILDGQVRLRHLEEALLKAATFGECWSVMRGACQTFGFAGVRMRFDGRVFEEHLQAVEAESCWVLRIPLSERDYINFERHYDSPAKPMLVAALVDMLKSRLHGKLRSLELDRSTLVRMPGQRVVPEVLVRRASGATD
jgi:UDP-GlcNAc:undecaprenyl-phosphate GlcNAc-1-phosphate transferase